MTRGWQAFTWLVIAGCGRLEFEVHGSRSGAVAAGQAHTCAITDGTLRCWGSNLAGQLGVGDVSPHAGAMIVAADQRWASVSAGMEHTCAITTAGQLSCWGGNAFGQLGLGDLIVRTTPTAVPLPEAAARVATMIDHTCAVLVDGSLYCWGLNDEGQLGLADAFGSPNHPSPEHVTGMFTDVDCGQGHTLALDALDALSGTGRNTGNELGLGTASTDGQLHTLTPITSVGPWRDISAGQNASCGVARTGALYCWGANGSSNLGTGDTTDRDVPFQIAGFETWSSVDIDTFSTCAVTAANVLYCWGRNLEGQLGLGDIVERVVPTATPIDDCAEVSVSRFHACAMRLDGSVWCTGGNSDGQLGIEDTLPRSVWTRVPLP